MLFAEEMLEEAEGIASSKMVNGVTGGILLKVTSLPSLSGSAVFSAVEPGVMPGVTFSLSLLTIPCSCSN